MEPTFAANNVTNLSPSPPAPPTTPKNSSSKPIDCSIPRLQSLLNELEKKNPTSLKQFDASSDNEKALISPCARKMTLVFSSSCPNLPTSPEPFGAAPLSPRGISPLLGPSPRGGDPKSPPRPRSQSKMDFTKTLIKKDSKLNIVVSPRGHISETAIAALPPLIAAIEEQAKPQLALTLGVTNSQDFPL